VIGAAVRAVASIVGEVLTLLFRFVEAQPRIALVIVAIVVLLIIITSIAYFWILLLGLVLVGAGLRLRQEDL
jgi:hypothetical protein